MAELIPIDPDLTDPRILLAIRQAENGGPGREMGVLSVTAPNYNAQVDVAARTVKNTEGRYTAATGLAPAENGRYTDAFVSYLSQGGPGYPGYAPQGAANDPTGLNANHLTNLSSAYGSTGGGGGPRLIPLDEPPGPTSDRLREGTSPPFTGLTAQPPPENWLAKNYRDYVAEPLTRAVETAPGYSIGDLDVRNPNAGEIREAPMVSPETARTLVPQTPAGGAAFIASLRAGPLGPLANFLYPAGAGGVTSYLSSNRPSEEALVEAVEDAATYGVGGYVGKKATDAATKVVSWLPYVKDKISETYARNFAGNMARIDPEVGRTIAEQEVSPWLRGGTTTAQMRQAATGQDIQRAASRTMETAIQKVDALSGQPGFAGPALNEGYDMLDDVVKSQIIGPVGLNGYTLHQAQAIRAEIGSAAFSTAAKERGIGDAALIKLRNGMTGEIESKLAPEALPIWREANLRYGGTMVGDEFLNMPAAKQGLPNRMFLNRNTLSDFLDQNRGELIRRMGREEYDAVVREVLGGAQPGTRDILTPGAGTPLAAFMQTLGRGTNTGSMNTLGVPLRTGLPGLGSEWTGRQPFTPDADIQALMAILGGQTAAKWRETLGGTPVKIGPLP